MAVTILILITLGDCLAPVGATLEVNVLNVSASVDDVGINTLTTISGIQVFVIGAEREGIAVRDSG